MGASATWWRPDTIAWWIGVLFAIGATLFLVPAVAALATTGDWTAVAFACGAAFFTGAALLQLIAAAEVPHRALLRERTLRPRSWMPARVDWIAAAIQLPGTVLFNVNTIAALDRTLSAAQADARVWTPDVLGSICFLASAGLAFANVEHEWLSWRPRDLDWQIAAANLGGAIAFGVSAVAAYVEPSTGEPVAAAVANAATAVGALGFLAGALLLLPQAARARRRAATG